jgi:hypothetical protein
MVCLVCLLSLVLVSHKSVIIYGAAPSGRKILQVFFKDSLNFFCWSQSARGGEGGERVMDSQGNLKFIVVVAE